MKPDFRLIIAGGRDFNDYLLLKKTCDEMLVNVAKTHDIVIVSGKARGADSLGETYAKEKHYKIAEFPADWDRFGKSAGYKRNQQMADYAKAAPYGGLIAFWDGQSKGTKHMIDIADRMNLKKIICYY